MRKFIKNLYIILKYNINTLFQYELLSKLLITTVFVPLIYYGYNIVMKITNYDYVIIDNITNFIFNPITIIYTIILILLIALITIFDMTNIIVILDESYHKKKINLKDTLKISLSKCKNIFKLKNISIIFLVLILMPFINIGIESNVIASITIPEFIMDYINSNNLCLTIYFIIYSILIILLSNWLYSLNYMVIEDKSFKEARVLSNNLIKKNKIKDLLKILITQVIISISYTLLILLGVYIIYNINVFLNNRVIIESILISIICVFMLITLLLFSIISNTISYGIINLLFYKHKNNNNEPIIQIDYEEKNTKNHNKLIITILIIISIITIAIGSIYTYQVITDQISLSTNNPIDIKITAHRGASSDYPENTMAAFNGAIALGANYIELDVQQTKDKQIVVCHDKNLNRVAKVKKNIIDMTYDEIKKIDVGSHFSDGFKDEKMPLLSDVLKLISEHDVILNIELKPTGKETNFEQQVIDLIKEYQVKNKCVVASLNYNTLVNIKNIDNSIKTVYVMSIAKGDITSINNVDVYSVESSNITAKMVDQVHNANKEIYAWTVNKEETINKMIDLHVDNIITDDVELTKSIIQDNNNINLLLEFIKELFK